MPTTVYCPLSVRVEPMVWRPVERTQPQHGLVLEYGKDKLPVTLSGVYLPESIRPAFEAGLVTKFALTELPSGGLAASVLPGAPSRLVTEIQLADCTRIKSVPPVLTRAQNRLRVQAGAAGVAASGLLCVSSAPAIAWAGALTLVLAIHWAKRAQELTIHPGLHSSDNSPSPV